MGVILRPRILQRDVKIDADFYEFFGYSLADLYKKYDTEFKSLPSHELNDGEWSTSCLNKYCANHASIDKESDIIKVYSSDEFSILNRCCSMHDDFFTAQQSRFSGWYDEEQHCGFKALDYFKDMSNVRMLDLGCGCPVQTMAIYMQGAKVDFSDVRSKYADYFRFLVNKYDLKDISFIDSSEETDYGKETYNYVWCSEMLEHTAEPLVYLKKLYDALQPGGVAFISITFGGGGLHLERNNARYGNLQTPIAYQVGFIPAKQLLGQSAKLDYSISVVNHLWTKE